jgi:hypothetical protein
LEGELFGHAPDYKRQKPGWQKIITRRPGTFSGYVALQALLHSI